MKKVLRLQCEKFVSGHLPLKSGEEFRLIADWCEDNNYIQDYYGKGDLIESFEAKIANLLGFENGCFMPSGTMAQQIALKIYSQHSQNDSFAIHPTSHLELHEQHGYSHLCNLKSVIIGDKNRQLNADDIESITEPISTIVIELPAREIGGQLPIWKELNRIKKVTRQKNVFLHMDGARLWETKAFYGKSYKEVCKGFDSVYVSFYKGIGSLTGAMLLGKSTFIEEARVWLRRFGGNLFQMHPFVASAAMRFDMAISQMPKYMKRTNEVYKLLKDIEGIRFCPNPPQVNMFHLYINASREKLLKARDKVAKEDKIWLANDFKATAIEDLSYTEIYVGEGLLNIKDKELLGGFKKLLKSSK